MTADKLSSILTPLRSALDYGVAASLNGDPQERKYLEEQMMNRLAHALDNAGFEIVRVERKAA